MTLSLSSCVSLEIPLLTARRVALFRVQVNFPFNINWYLGKWELRHYRQNITFEQIVLQCIVMIFLNALIAKICSSLKGLCCT